jgi:hypothetical protein
MDTVVELTERTGASAMGLSVRLGRFSLIGVRVIVAE